MTLIKAAAVSALVLASLGAAPADAHGSVRFGFAFGVPLYPPAWYYPPPAYYYPPPVVAVPSAPPVYIERPQAQAQPAPQGESFWYYCPDSKTYYPYVQQCASAWRPVSPRPPGAS